MPGGGAGFWVRFHCGCFWQQREPEARAMALGKLSWPMLTNSALKSSSGANQVQTVMCRTWASGRGHHMMSCLAIPALCAIGGTEEFQLAQLF